LYESSRWNEAALPETSSIATLNRRYGIFQCRLNASRVDFIETAGVSVSALPIKAWRAIET
jgi:hypothetical protein